MFRAVVPARRQDGQVNDAERSNVEPPGRRRPGPRRGQGEPTGPVEVREAVLEAATRVFGRNGVEAASLREIAAEANVQPGLINRYVGKRDNLIDAVYQRLTAELVADIDGAPLRPHGFDRDSTMGRWTAMTTYYALHGRALPPLERSPVSAIAAGIRTHYGADDQTARRRAAQIVGSALGWRLFERQLAEMGGIEARDLPEIRLDLNLLHNIAGSLPWPTEDPRPNGQR